MKRLFISFLISYLVVGFISGLYFTSSQYSLAYLGGFTSALVGVLYFIGIYTFHQSQNNTKAVKIYTVGIYFGLLLTLVSLYLNPEPVHYFAAFYTGLLLVMWEKYLSWYSIYTDRSLNITIDKKLPSGELFTPENKAVSVKELTVKPTVWLFYRGNWCPFCTAQIQNLVKNYIAISNLGYQLVFVSHQPQRQTEKLTQKFKVDVQFLMDKDAAYAKTIGMVDSGGLPLGLEVLGYNADVLYPAIVVTDQKGVVRYYDLTDNYRDRPEAEMVIEELNRLKA